MMPRPLSQNLSFFAHVRLFFSFAVFCILVDPTETRKTYRAVFSEPRVVIPVTSDAVPRDVVECEQASEQPLEAVLTPSHTEEAMRSSDGRQKKRAGDSIEPADAGRVRKKKKSKK